MILRLTDEMRQAIHDAQGMPVELVDDHTSKKYLLVDSSGVQHIWDEWVQRSLQVAFSEVDRGMTVPWDPERVKEEGRTRLNGQ